MTPRTAALGISVSLLALALIFGLAACRFGSKPFDSARWKAQRGADCMQMSRSEMVDDLRSHRLSNGMTKREVRRLLGKPDYDIGVDLRGRGIWWSYVTGPDLVDCSLLDLRFKNGRLEETSIGQN